MKKTLIIGYGNPDRQDDGLALHLLVEMAKILNWLLSDPPEDTFFPQGRQPDLWFCLQLVPEMAETVSQYDRVCFLDAHTGLAEEIIAAPLAPAFQVSALTHHLAPASLLSICQALSNRVPEAVLISVQGDQFGFSRDLSTSAERRVPLALQYIQSWLGK